ncbi:hypothetical protein NA56DRAFT_173782 [Hyaloscypha hepaticicola]|uniref:CorA-like transporter domain-containing protein n=1 Tax=Hyaloscypha hepaticicola TaxID=2082293 RepID=A0A2J6Q367_9HELO|nr:hypothetical protein NA56DRAFT_173782 [Hyaloscypha hepaticicola]
MTQVNDCPEAAGVTKATAVYAEPQSELPSTQEFDNQAQLFTDDAEKSWVEFRAARGKDNYNLDLFRDGSEVPEKGSPLQSCDTSSIITRPEKTRQLPQRTDDYSGETLRDYSKVLEKEFPWRSCDASGILTEPQEIRLLPNIRNPVHVFFIRQKNSNGRLLISAGLFEALISSNQIFERFKEFVMSFGWKKREHDIGPPLCRFEVDEAGPRTRSPGSFGNYECAYGLRYVEKNGYGDKKEPWSVRQTAIYQKYEDGMETWVFISASKQAEIKAIEFIDQCGVNRSSSTTPFDLHLILLEVALANWRWYIKSLVERTTEHSSRVIAATVGKGKLSALIDFEINFEDRQGLKVIEEKVLDLLTIFESTSDTITTLLREYEYMQSNTAMKRDRVVSKLQDNLREVDLYAKKVDTLHKRVQGTASLLSNLLDYENAKIAQDNGDSLKILAQESREENVAMRLLSEKSTKDAAAVKVITLITIVFLPTTVVSGFFSTQFVRQSEDGQTLLLTDNWWIIAAISLPLTAFTIAIWYCWIRFPWQKWWDQKGRPWRRAQPADDKPQSRLPQLEFLHSIRHSELDMSALGSRSGRRLSRNGLYSRTSTGRDSWA